MLGSDLGIVMCMCEDGERHETLRYDTEGSILCLDK